MNMSTNGNGQSEHETHHDVILEAWQDALAGALAQQQREWARERKLIEAEAARAIADMRKEMLELRAEVADHVALRLASLHNGLPGLPGAQGPEGSAGPQGTSGPQGERGEPGSQGMPGDPGPIGLQGPPGDTRIFEAEAARTMAEMRVATLDLGAKLGDIVAKRLAELHDGKDGAPGERWCRAKRPQGSADLVGMARANVAKAARPVAAGEGRNGATGDEPGPIGLQGPRGERGEAGPQGEQGAPGEIGIAGSQGERGPSGEHGKDGAPGERGEKGDSGARGEMGPQGPQGMPGVVGKDGEIGPGRVRWARVGSQGRAGLPGKLPIVKAFKSGGVHYEADVVTHLGASLSG